MPDDPRLLTVVLESTEDLDREGVTYRRLLAARLKFEDKYDIRISRTALDTDSIRETLTDITSKYVVFVRSVHEITSDYLPTILKHLQSRTVYLAEPVVFTGAIPKNVSQGAPSPYTRDTDVFGTAFNTARLRDFLEACPDLDRSSLYIGYRLYWTISKVTPLGIGYSMASDTKAAIGLQLAPGVTRLVPLIANNARVMRTYVLRLLVLYLRGLRESGDSDMPLAHVREVVRLFNLTAILADSQTLQPFETAWIRWIDDTSTKAHLYKRLPSDDNYLVFAQGREELDADIELYRCRMGEDVVKIGKSYLPSADRPGNDDPAIIDYYRHPISESSTILFFDRPMQADDNAEHLYRYFLRNHPEFRNIYFALNPKSPDWQRLADEGYRLVHMFSKEFRELYLESDVVISSQIYNLSHQGKTLANSRFIYLQHGIQLNDMSDWVLSKYFDVFVATGKLEADYLGALAPRETLNSGLPRLESLRRRSGEPRRLLFMPTWRFNLHQLSHGAFTRSTYYAAIDSVLTDKDLLDFLDAQDMTLQVKLHPNVEKRAHLFHFSDRVVHSTMSYREAFQTAEMVFTDYSSAVLDAAFIGTPIAYYQWDEAEFFDDQPYESRLDYHTQGLGPVFTEHGNLIEHITTLAYRDDDSEFSRRREVFFEGVDPTRISETIVERMLSL